MNQNTPTFLNHGQIDCTHTNWPVMSQSCPLSPIIPFPLLYCLSQLKKKVENVHISSATMGTFSVHCHCVKVCCNTAAPLYNLCVSDAITCNSMFGPEITAFFLLWTHKKKKTGSRGDVSKSEANI